MKDQDWRVVNKEIWEVIRASHSEVRRNWEIQLKLLVWLRYILDCPQLLSWLLDWGPALLVVGWLLGLCCHQWEFLPPLVDTLMITINALIGQLNRIKCSLAQTVMIRKIIISHISQNFYTYHCTETISAAPCNARLNVKMWPKLIILSKNLEFYPPR